MDLLAPSYSALALMAAALAGFIIGRITATWSTPKRRRQTVEHVKAVEEEVRKLPPALAAAIRSDLVAGNTINAVKRVRDSLGCDLKEARDIVERINS